MNKKRASLLIVLILGVSLLSFSEEPLPFYGRYIKIADYIKHDEIQRNLDQSIEQEDFDAALKQSDEVISTDPDIAFGYYLKFRTGMAKKDLDTVQNSLKAMEDKYFVRQTLYNSIHNVLSSVEDKDFKAQAEVIIKAFLEQREAFLKDKLKRKVNQKAIYKELAFINNLTGNEDEFLENMKQILPYDWYFSQNFPEKRKDPEDERFKNLKNEFYFKQRNWEGTTEEKIKGLMMVATEMRYWNASLDFSEIVDWNSHAASFIPRVLESKNLAQYYEVLTEMVGKVGENHTIVYFPPDITQKYSGCGVKLLYAGEKFLVERVDKEELKGKIKPGDEIISIDGVAVKTYIEKHKSIYPLVRHYYCKPRTYAMHNIADVLLNGIKDSHVSVELACPSGKIYSLSLKRDAYETVKKQSGSKNNKLVEREILKDSIYYFNIKRFYGSDIYQDFLELIKDLDTKEAKGVIIDLRTNGGGNSGYGDSIFSHFIDEPLNNYVFSYHPARLPRRESTQSLGLLSLFKGGSPIEPASEKRFSCPVVLLISPRTGSAAEDFSFCFKYHKRGTIVGLPSGGATGMGRMLLLPGGGSMRITLNVDIFFCWRGIQPDYWVDFSSQDIVEGRDPQMEKALEILKLSRGK